MCYKPPPPPPCLQSSNEVNEKNAPSCSFDDIMSPQAFKASLAAKGVAVSAGLKRHV